MKHDVIHRTVAMLEPEELRGALRLLAVYQRAGWVTAVEAQQSRQAINARAIGLHASLVDDPGSLSR